MTRPTIAFICGSLRAESYNRRFGRAIMEMTADRLDMHEIPIGDLALYSEDLDADPPASYRTFWNALDGVDGILFGCPEYNRSMTGALKNAIDVGSRPDGHNSWQGKRAALFSSSPGMRGGVSANLALRPSLVALGMEVMGQPEAYWGSVNEAKIDLAGDIHDDMLKKLVKRFASAMAEWMGA